MRISPPAIAITIAAAVFVSCAANPPTPTAEPHQAGARQAPVRRIADGVVTQVSSGHGNAYTSIGPEQYGPLGLEPGSRIHVAFADTAVTLPVGRAYADVPSGTPLAVLHREGLTFAIRDGDFSAAYGIAAGSAFRISIPSPNP